MVLRQRFFGLAQPSFAPTCSLHSLFGCLSSCPSPVWEARLVVGAKLLEMNSLRGFMIVVFAFLIVAAKVAQAQNAAVPTEATPESIFAAQVTLNSVATSIATPRSDHDEEWEDWPKWSGPAYFATTTFVLVRIDDPMIVATASYWTASLGLDENNRRQAEIDLRNRYNRAGSDAYLFISPPLGGSYPDWWAYEVQFENSVKLIDFSGNKVEPTEVEPCPDQIIYFESPVFSCLVFFPKQLDDTQPFYFVDVDYRPLIRHNSRYWWVQPTRTHIARFRVEHGMVPLVQLTRRNLDWAQVQEVYVDSHINSISASQGDAAGALIADLGISILRGLLFRGLRVR